MPSTAFTHPFFEQALPGRPAAFRMIPVEGGVFAMGGESSKPVHDVELSDFLIGQHPVTQELWEAVMGAGSNRSYFRGRQRPVEGVSWFDAAVFCNALNALCGYEPVYFADAEYRRPYGKTASGYALPEHADSKDQVLRRPGAAGYRLPTEAEWEYAARGGKHSGGYVYAGGEKLDEVGWYSYNSHRETKPVGLKLSNELGVYDMSGNVREWCEDWYGSDYYQECHEKGVVKNPVGPAEGASRVCRGGSWNDYAGRCRASLRGLNWPEYRDFNIGFRLVLVFLAGSGRSACIP